jgi:hypothetical protein
MARRQFPLPASRLCHYAGAASRTLEKSREPGGLTVQSPFARMRPTLRADEAESKMDDPLSGSWERCRWPHTRPVPEVHSGSLRWQK